MELLRNIKVPTGNIMIVEGDKGKLECLSIGDYGKEANLKASFLGLDRAIEQVDHQEMLPLEEKWVVTISTQYGCSMNCVFCDVPKVGKGINATYNDLRDQVVEALKLHPEVESTKRLNVHFARMGEPTWNPNVIEFSRNLLSEVRPYIGRSFVHPVVSTMMPKNNKNLSKFLADWMEIKNYTFRGEAGLKFSINSTSNEERNKMFSGNSLSLEEISEIGKNLDFPKGRKITLNFAVAGYEVDAKRLRTLFDPDKFLVKLTPMHKTHTAVENGIETDGDYTTMYPYLHIEEELKAEGFDVIVFIASEYEDLGRITCGNAILSGTNPDCPYEDIEIIKDSKIRGCGVIIRDENNRILMGQRVKSQDSSQWCIPGGKIEKGESPVEGAIREVYEECGLIIKEEDIEFVYVHETNTCDDYTFYVNKFIGSVEDNPSEMINFKWFMNSDIATIDKQKDMFLPTFNSLLAFNKYELSKIINK